MGTSAAHVHATSVRRVTLGLMLGCAAAGCGPGTGARGREAAAAHRSLRTFAARARARVRVTVIGRSALGRSLYARVVGDPRAKRRVLVVGCIHGTETAGRAITYGLRSGDPPPGSAWWIVDAINPDGCRAGTRGNANGVDLNRNSPWHWRALDQPGGTFYSGPRSLSEPESRAVNALVRRVRPAVSIWYHQRAGLVDSSSGGDVALERRYAALAGLPLRAYGTVPGSITSWQNATFTKDTAFVVELPAGPVSRESVADHVAAIRAVSASRTR
jgi:murein peptide amidase A